GGRSSRRAPAPLAPGDPGARRDLPRGAGERVVAPATSRSAHAVGVTVRLGLLHPHRSARHARAGGARRDRRRDAADSTAGLRPAWPGRPRGGQRVLALRRRRVGRDLLTGVPVDVVRMKSGMNPHTGVPADTLAPLVVAFGAMLILGGVVWSP